MSRLASVLIPADGYVIMRGVTNNTATSIVLSTNRMFAINADQDIMIAFFSSQGGSTTAATNNGYRIPANQQTTFDMGPGNNTITVFNLGTANGSGGQTGTSAANIYVIYLGVA